MDLTSMSLPNGSKTQRPSGGA
jgi:hypothetical protein